MSQGRKTLLLWVILIAMLYSAYRAAERGGEAWIAITAVFIVVVGALVIWANRGARGLREAHRLNDEGLKLLFRGESFEALKKFEEAHAHAKENLAVRANMALACLYLWKLERAYTLYSGLREETKNYTTVPIAATAALSAAMHGRASEGNFFEPLLDTNDLRNAPEGLLARGALRARAGHFREALTALDRHEGEQLGGTMRAMREALAAFCASELGEPARTFDRVKLFGPADPGELEKDWPELHAFVMRGTE